MGKRELKAPRDWPGTGEPPTLRGYRAPYTHDVAAWLAVAHDFIATMPDVRRRRTTFLVLAHMVAHITAKDSFADGTPMITVSAAQLAEEVGMKRDTVADALGRLTAEGGPLVCRWKPKRGQQFTSCYALRPPEEIRPITAGATEGGAVMPAKSTELPGMTAKVVHARYLHGESGHDADALSCPQSPSVGGHDATPTDPLIMPDKSVIMPDNSLIMPGNSTEIAGTLSLILSRGRGAAPQAPRRTAPPLTSESTVKADSCAGSAARAEEGAPHPSAASSVGAVGGAGPEGADNGHGLDAGPWAGRPWAHVAERIDPDMCSRLAADETLERCFMAVLEEHPDQAPLASYAEAAAMAYNMRMSLGPRVGGLRHVSRDADRPKDTHDPEAAAPFELGRE